MSSVQHLPSATDRAILTAEYDHLSPARLFECFTNPALLALWWAPEGEVEGRVGGAYHL